MAAQKEIKIEVVEDRPMTEAEFETFVGILFNLWRRWYENEASEL